MPTRGNSYSLVKHWDGTGWRAFSTPAKMRELYTVDSVSSTDVWAGGSGGIMHWDGTTRTRVGKWERADPHEVDGDRSDDVWEVSGSGGIQR